MDSFWDWLLRDPSLKSGIKKHGHYTINRDILARKWLARTRSLKMPPLSAFGAERLSQTSRPMNDNELYLMKAGRGDFIVFDMRVFLPPFLSLNPAELNRGEQLPIKLPAGYRQVAMHFRRQWNEQTFLKALHFCGAFSQLVYRLSRHRTHDYITGPSGPTLSCFPFWMKRNGVNAVNHSLARFDYNGVVDLDDCLYVRESNLIIPIEAKMQYYQDLAWHKLAFPCYRFIPQPRLDNKVANTVDSRKATTCIDHCSKSCIMPAYCAYDASVKEAIIHLFPKILTCSRAGIHNLKGIVLNDKERMTPTRIFRIDMSWI